MDSDKDFEDLSKDAFHQIVDYRTRIYENLARDALQLLSIQLLIIPISLSIVSLLIEVVSRSDAATETDSVITWVIQNIDYSLFQFGIVFGIVAISLSSVVYHFARKKAMESPNMLFNRHYPEALSKDPAFEEGYISKVAKEVKTANERIVERHGDYLDTRSYQEKIRTRFDGPESDRTSLRLLTSLSLIGTLSSALLILLSLIKPLYPPILQLATLLAVIAFIIFVNLPYPMFILLTIERIFGIAKKSLGILNSIVDKSTKLIARQLSDAVSGHPKATFLLLIYFSMSTSGIYLGPKEGSFHQWFIAIGLLFGTLGILIGLKNRFEKLI